MESSRVLFVAEGNNICAKERVESGNIRDGCFARDGRSQAAKKSERRLFDVFATFSELLCCPTCPGMLNWRCSLVSLTDFC